MQAKRTVFQERRVQLDLMLPRGTIRWRPERSFGFVSLRLFVYFILRNFKFIFVLRAWDITLRPQWFFSAEVQDIWKSLAVQLTQALFFFLNLCIKGTFQTQKRIVSFFVPIVQKVKVKVAQLCPTLCDPMDYRVHGILQARILEWVAIPFSRGSVPAFQGLNPGLPHSRRITSLATREA